MIAKGDTHWEQYVEFDESLKRPSDVPVLVGDASKAQAKLGWTAKTRMKKLVSIMVEADLKRLA